MKASKFNRRSFIRSAATTAAGLVVLPAIAKGIPTVKSNSSASRRTNSTRFSGAARIKFSVIGINHNHINAQVEAVLRGGGEFVSFYAKETDLADAFSKR